MKPRIAIPIPNSRRMLYVRAALPQYQHAIRAAGGEPVVIEVRSSPSEIANKVKQCDGVLLPGSPADVDPEKYGAERHAATAAADPYRDNTDELLLQDAYNMRKPVFGICYGLQSLNVWRTGTLVQDLATPIKHNAGRSVSEAHRVHVEPQSRLAAILQDVGIVRAGQRFAGELQPSSVGGNRGRWPARGGLVRRRRRERGRRRYQPGAVRAGSAVASRAHV